MTRLFAVPVQGTDSDDRYTPPAIVRELGRFDLDPCAPPGGPLHGMADRWFTAEDDGLAHLWEGRVFMNPPYSDTTPWADRFRRHANGIALLPVSAAHWKDRIIADCHGLVMTPQIAFVGRTHQQVYGNMPTMFVAYGPGNVAALRRLLTSGVCGGRLFTP